MGRLWQVFSGPDELEALPDDGYESPWTFPAQVRIPMEHWEAIIVFAREHAQTDSALLERASLLDGKTLNVATEMRFVTILDALAKAVAHAPRLTPDDSDPASIPEPMPNASHVAMLRDVMRLVRRTRELGVAFDSWVD
jgi:hypothetical protein